MRALARLVQFELGAPGNDVFAEMNEGLDNVAQRKRFRPAAADCEHIGGETRLRRCVAPDLVQHDLGSGVALQLDDHAHTFARTFVPDVGNALDPLVLGGFGDLLDQTRFADLERNGSQHDGLAIAAAHFDFVSCALEDGSAPGSVGGMGAMVAEDDRRSRKIGPRNDREKLFAGDRRVFDESETSVDHFTQIVRRDVGRHAHRDAAGTIDQQIGEAGGEDRWLSPAAIVVIREIDGVLVEIVQQAVGHARKARFGIAHAGRWIGVHAAEVALAVDQRKAHRPILGHTRQRVVDRGIAVRVVVTHHVADDLGALAVGAASDEAAFLAGEKNAAMNRLQAVAHVRKCAAHDHAHRVIEIAGLHLIDYVDAGISFTAGCRRVDRIVVVTQFDMFDCCRPWPKMVRP